MEELNTNINEELGQGYQLNDKEEFFDPVKGEVVDKKDLSPWEVIKATAIRLGYEVKDPNKSCKHCYGRGYIGLVAGTKQPIPCNCIYSQEQKKTMQVNPAWNRATKRNPLLRKEMKQRLRNLEKLQSLKDTTTIKETTSATDSIDVDIPVMNIETSAINEEGIVNV
jgi:hypothetical protein